MSTIPQPILDALTAVQADADNLAGATATASASAAAATAAQAQASTDAAAVATAQQHLAADLQALIALETSTYGAPMQAPPPPPATGSA